MQSHSVTEGETIVIDKKDLNKIDNMQRDLQTIGFVNMPHYVRGYIDYLELRNLELDLQLAEVKSEPVSKIESLRKQISLKRESIKNTYGVWSD